MNKRRQYVIYLISAFAALTAVALGQDRVVEIKDISGRQIHLMGFTLSADRTVQIKAVGAGGEKEIHRIHNFQEDKYNLFAYAWILDARSRKMVWRMTIGNTKDDWWEKYHRVFDGEVSLKKGEYELYFSAVEPGYFVLDEGFPSIGRIMKRIFEDDEWWSDSIDKWKVSVSGVDEVYNESAVKKYQKAVKSQAVVSFTSVGNNAYRKKAFGLKRRARLHIYALGEGYKGEMYDSGWIVNADTREKVWEMREKQTKNAGGAIKNRVADEFITLDAGHYVVYYRSDGNHSAHGWNANPPYDPNFWGITLAGADEDFDKNTIAEIEESSERPIVSLDRLGDDEDVTEGFTLLKTAKLRIYAIGEGRAGEMFDYGWITDAHTGRVVWEMKYRDTDNAGGAEKNRLYDRIKTFEPGSYIVHFTTDDSHSYEDWNQSRPHDPEGWGIKIYTIGSKSSENIVKKYEPEKDQNILIQLIRVGDDEHVKKQFSLNKDSRVRIYAIGEGDWDEMYDYGWIEDFDTGRTVWTMRYRDTRRAGGNSKNRLYDDVVSLRAGTYIAHFRTDDSHAYRSWNASPPRDKSNWGITIYKVPR